jgi:hypothetical protein
MNILRTPFQLAVVAALTPMAYGLDLRPTIDPLAQALIDDSVAIGFVVGIVKDGQMQVIAYGETTKGSRVAPNGDTVYEILHQNGRDLDAIRKN